MGESIAKREAKARYLASPKGKAMLARYAASESNRRRRERDREARQATYEAVAAIKIERGCADCGYNAHPVALDFDHIHGTKTAAVSKMISNHKPWKEIYDEINKCEVVCANCHRIRTIQRLGATRG